jgi:hypothetical protein
MKDDEAFEHATRAWLEDGSDRTPATTIDAVLLAVRTTPQERDLRIPWRTAPMSNPLRLVAAIAVIVVAGVAAFNLFGPSPGVGGLSSPSPTVTPSAAAPTLSPQPSPSPIDTSTWTTYVSDRYGFSIGHPADWTVRPADHDWTIAADDYWFNTAWETFEAPDATIGISAWSVAVEPGTSVDAWLQANCPKYDTPCTGIQDRAIVVSLDGHPGILVPFTDDLQAFILVDSRMYVVASGRPAAAYDSLRLLQAYLSTMHLLPGGPAPSVTSPSPS